MMRSLAAARCPYLRRNLPCLQCQTQLYSAEVGPQIIEGQLWT